MHDLTHHLDARLKRFVQGRLLVTTEMLDAIHRGLSERMLRCPNANPMPYMKNMVRGMIHTAILDGQRLADGELVFIIYLETCESRTVHARRMPGQMVFSLKRGGFNA